VIYGTVLLHVVAVGDKFRDVKWHCFIPPYMPLSSSIHSAQALFYGETALAVVSVGKSSRTLFMNFSASEGLYDVVRAW